MNLLVSEGHHSKPYVYIVEKDDYWRGQMKHIGWLETHNEDCDTHQMNSDMDWN